MRIYRSNPMNSVGRLPTIAGGAVVVLVLAVLGLGAFGVWSELTMVARHGPQIEQAVAARGLGAAKVEAVRKAGCGRARRRHPQAAGVVAGSFAGLQRMHILFGRVVGGRRPHADIHELGLVLKRAGHGPSMRGRNFRTRIEDQADGCHI